VLGGQVGTVGHIEIGKGAQVGAQSGVSKNVPPGEIWFGYPAMPLKETKEQLARIALLPRYFDRVKRLEQAAREAGKSSSAGA
jgi:UDP-3-O-[3-hydroxymyristoyl] glucosamine N-acyltransferase